MPFKVEFKKTFNNQTKLAEILTPYCALWQSSIHVWSSWGESLNKDLFDPEAIHIISGGNPWHILNERATYKSKFFDIELNGSQRTCYNVTHPCDKDEHRILEDDRVFASILTEESIAIIFYVNVFYPPFTFLTKAMDEVSKEFMKIERKNNTKDNYLYFRDNIHNAEVNNLKLERSDVQVQLSRSLNSIVEDRIKMDSLSIKIEALSRSTNKNEDLQEELKRLLKHEMINKVLCYKNKIVVYTKPYETKPLSDGLIRLLGEYKITYNGYNMPMVENITRQVNGRLHPHSNNLTSPCWGNVAVGITELAARGKVEALIFLVLDWLSFVDENETYGKHVYEWPVKGKRGGVNLAVPRSTPVRRISGTPSERPVEAAGRDCIYCHRNYTALSPIGCFIDHCTNEGCCTCQPSLSVGEEE